MREIGPMEIATFQTDKCFTAALAIWESQNYQDNLVIKTNSSSHS